MMRKFAPWLIVALAAAPALADKGVRVLQEEFSPESHETVWVKVPVGELRVVGTSSDRGSIEVTVNCKRSRRRCEDAAERIEIDTYSRRHRLVVELEGFPRWGLAGISLEVVARIPSSNPVAIDMGVGEVEVEQLTADVAVDLGIGEVAISMQERFARSVELEVGIGDVSLETADGRVKGSRFFLGNEVEWKEGPGGADIDVDLGIGEASVELE